MKSMFFLILFLVVLWGCNGERNINQKIRDSRYQNEEVDRGDFSFPHCENDISKFQKPFIYVYPASFTSTKFTKGRAVSLDIGGICAQSSFSVCKYTCYSNSPGGFEREVISLLNSEEVIVADNIFYGLKAQVDCLNEENGECLEYKVNLKLLEKLRKIEKTFSSKITQLNKFSYNISVGLSEPFGPFSGEVWQLEGSSSKYFLSSEIELKTPLVFSRSIIENEMHEKEVFSISLDGIGAAEDNFEGGYNSSFQRVEASGVSFRGKLRNIFDQKKSPVLINIEQTE